MFDILIDQYFDDDNGKEEREVNLHMEKKRLRKVGGFDFSNQNLRGRDFSNIDINFADFSGSDLTNVNFSNSDLFNCNFSRCNLTNANFQRSAIGSGVLKDSQCCGANFHLCDIFMTEIECNKDLKLDGAILDKTNKIIN